MANFFLGRLNTRSELIQNRELMTDQSYEYHQSPIIEVTYRNMGEMLLTGAENTQRQTYHQSSPLHG